MSRQRPGSRPVAVKEILQGFLNPGDLAALKERQQIRRVWEAVLPAKLLTQTRLLDFRRKELWVEVRGGPGAQELHFLKPRILQELERVLGPGKIRDLRVRVGEFNQIKEDAEIKNKD
jgi:hypothetical protein